jgi:hypothetical protein
MQLNKRIPPLQFSFATGILLPIIALAVLFLAVGWLVMGTMANAQITHTYNPFSRSIDYGNNPNAVSNTSTWNRYRVTLGAGGWAVSKNGATAGADVAAEADTSQDVVLFAKAARQRIDNLQVKTATACAGATTITLGAGVASSGALFLAALYDLKAAVTDVNYSTGIAAALLTGGTTFAAENVTARVVTTVENVSQITVGCALDVFVLTSVLP